MLNQSTTCSLLNNLELVTMYLEIHARNQTSQIFGKVYSPQEFKLSYNIRILKQDFKNASH
jgi:hypothetical protein